MIFYFTGTGNSLYTAKAIASQQGEELVSIVAAVRGGGDVFEYELRENEIIGFVCPVHAWGPPPIVMQFIRKLKLRNYQGNYSFVVLTCGGSTGNAVKRIARSLKAKGLTLSSGYSVIMPNNFILMGNVDSEEVQQQKLSAAEEVLQEINEAVARKARQFKMNRGPVPWLFSGVFHPMFAKSKVDQKKFYATDQCTGCGICVKVCNTGNIRLDAARPEWGADCTQCAACLHFCPSQAVQYGKATVNKGRYVNPNISLVEISKGRKLS